MKREIKLPYGSTLIMEPSNYEIKGEGMSIISTNLLDLLESWLESIVRRRTRPDNTTEITDLIDELTARRLHFLGRMQEILMEIPLETRDELMKEITEEIQNEDG